MQPFALQTPKKSRSPWIFAMLCAAVFGAWYFDVIPQIRTVATGTIADMDPNAGQVGSELESALDEIVDRSSDGSPAVEVTDDKLLSAIDSVSEPLDLTSESGLSEPSDFRNRTGDSEEVSREVVTANAVDATDGQVVRSSFNIPAEHQATPARQLAAIPPDLAETLREVDANYRQDRILDAHETLSKLYWSHPEFLGQIRSRIEHTSRLIYTSPDLPVNEPYLVEFGDTLESIGKKYKVPWQFLARLNRIPDGKIQAGQRLKVLTGPFSAVVDVRDFALTVHAHGWFVKRYAIGVGRENKTPKGEYTVLTKLENPKWYNPDGGEIDSDDPLNPLGEYWLGIGDHLGIHGTIDPDSIGKAASRGCIHMADADIEEVFHFLGIGSPVLIRE